MARKLAELHTECESNNLIVATAGKKLVKADYEEALRDFYWQRDHADEEMAEQITPMLARNLKDVTADTADSMWTGAFVAQEKVNGVRCILRIRNPQQGRVNHLTSRRVSDQTFRFSQLHDNLAQLRDLIFGEAWDDTVLDGELLSPQAVVDTEGAVTRNVLQATTAQLNCSPEKSGRIQARFGSLEYHVFDCLRFQGRDIRKLPYVVFNPHGEIDEDAEHRFGFAARVLSHAASELGNDTMKLLPLVTRAKRAYYEKTVRDGGEGVILKDPTAPYIQSGRPKSWFKVKRFEEADCFVTAGEPGKEKNGWALLTGALVFSAYTETGELHEVAKVSSIPFEDRCKATVCGHCDGPLHVSHETSDGRLQVLGTSCSRCGTGNPSPALNPAWRGRVACVQGQEYSARSVRLCHAKVERWRTTGVDGKQPDDCQINLALIKSRWTD